MLSLITKARKMRRKNPIVDITINSKECVGNARNSGSNKAADRRLFITMRARDRILQGKSLRNVSKFSLKNRTNKAQGEETCRTS